MVFDDIRKKAEKFNLSDIDHLTVMAGAACTIIVNKNICTKDEMLTMMDTFLKEIVKNK